MIELRRQIEKQSTDLGSAHRSLSDLRSKNAELEERLMQVNKELHGAQEFAKNLDIDLKVKKQRFFTLHFHDFLPTSFRQEFSKKSLNVTKSEK